MKTITLDPCEAAGEGEDACDGRHVAMESGVKARDLKYVRITLATELEHPDLGRKMPRRIVDNTPEFTDQLGIYSAVGAITCAPMDDPMPNGNERDTLRVSVEPVQQVCDCVGVVQEADRLLFLTPARNPHAEFGVGAPKAVELSPQTRGRRSGSVYGEFQTRRSTVQRKDMADSSFSHMSLSTV